MLFRNEGGIYDIEEEVASFWPRIRAKIDAIDPVSSLLSELVLYFKSVLGIFFMIYLSVRKNSLHEFKYNCFCGNITEI